MANWSWPEMDNFRIGHLGCPQKEHVLTSGGSPSFVREDIPKEQLNLGPKKRVDNCVGIPDNIYFLSWK
jgi:hypothetical protein